MNDGWIADFMKDWMCEDAKRLKLQSDSIFCFFYKELLQKCFTELKSRITAQVSRLVCIHFSSSPYLSYCNLVWVSTHCTRLVCSTTLQKRIVRIVYVYATYLRGHTAHVGALSILSLGILPCGNMNKLQVGIFMHRLHMRLLPSGFSKRTQKSCHQTRSSIKHHQISTITTISQHSIRIIWAYLCIYLTCYLLT